ncbi:Nitrilotriacetate monooxygenase component A/pristinamycin IIA synthase subunit A [Tilletiaria anomala UBC 951]|uniref:Nitrilotriacetate monooxygenase component A/pristinamycin IIA synthase subunit A n=1 Tax=Tilletiaria anomala (strain ATCC 24038 / CBS 436.72 / UBC 951) TaxID=1037660 RepID=A0A066VCD7_TILAU|nr:Nitrilotriacetate monooxygenase component A/pristinamycin IIA synthase subunit A [Tilletiaria anomala UBC 951]KDN39382.1 Nitrilotriacetate monooxygenase component A/pristinamycin IIA synthase subunit A [Tilletiaria anomala UBC 951]
MAQGQKRWILYAFDMSCSGHQSPGLFSHPKDKSANFDKLEYWTDLAQVLEKGKFDGLFLADVLGGYDVYNGNLDAALRSGAQFPVTDPFQTISAMAHVTKNLTFGITTTTSYEHPYLIARRFSTLDHLTKGRVGINVVTGYLDSAARQFGSKNQELHAKRYEVAHEYMDVLYKLWESSWADDALKLDAEKHVYTDPARVRAVNHKGTYYSSIPGPHIVHPSPQRTPVIFQAGSSGAGMAFAAKHAEVIFIAAHKPELAKKRVDQFREGAKAAGRDPLSVKVLALLAPIVAATDEKAQEKFEEYFSHGSAEGALALFGGWTGMDLGPFGDEDELRAAESNAIKSAVENFAHQAPSVGKWTKGQVANQLKIGGLGPFIVGGPQKVVNELEKWVNEAGVDGFNLAYAITPGTFQDFIKYVTPELQRRGHVWADYPQPQPPAQPQAHKKTGEPGFGEESAGGVTLREHLYGLGQPRLRRDHYASKFTWKAGEPAPALG